MLDLNHPQTPHIFAASNQLDMILGFCKRISVSEGKGRADLVEIVRPCFAAIRWLNSQRFGDSLTIADAITDMEHAAEHLAALGKTAEWTAIPPTTCPVCGVALTTDGVYEPRPGLKVPKERWCSPCLQVVMPALQRLRAGFGTEAI